MAREHGAESPAAPLVVERLSHAFGARQALSDVSLSVGQGDFTVLLGLNGAGKTTLFALITGLYHSRKGAIRVFGHDLQNDAQAALRRMGVVFQQATLDLDLTIEQNLFYHAALHGMPRSTAMARIDEELERVGLAARRRERVRLLSGGQRRRVELARALIHNPSLLLLDEPTVGLDMASRQFLLDHVRGLCAKEGLGVLWATHLIDEAGADARIVILHQGRVRAAGERAEILARAGETSLKAAFDRLIAEDAMARDGARP
jgi:ABC-2 type transport system ATP-binding protein